jgi:hypothetical protein
VPGFQRGRGAGEEVQRVARKAGLEPQAQIGLEDLAGGDALAAGRHGLRVAGRPRCDRREGADLGRSPLRTLGETTAQHLEAPSQIAASLGRPERLEPPLPGPVEAQQVVVEREGELGQRRGSARPGRHALQAGAERVAEEAEPATPHDGVAVAGGQRLPV